MILILLIPLYILANAYVLRWLFRWFEVLHTPYHMVFLVLIIACYVLLALSLLLTFFLKFRWLAHTANIWFAMFPYVFLSILLCDGVRLFMKYVLGLTWSRDASMRTTSMLGFLCLAVTALITLYGFISAKRIRTVHYHPCIDKEGGPKDRLRIVLIADLHLGYNTGYKMMRQMARKIEAQRPDLVIIAGDIFDNDFDALKTPEKVAEVLRNIKSRYGVYACYGNHDISEKILAGFTFGHRKEKASDPRMDAFLRDAGIVLLRDEGVTIGDGIYLYGRPDLHRPNLGAGIRKTPEEITRDLDWRRPIIVIDHQPAELSELASAGVDLDLSGHTHGGQMFPGVLTIRLLWKNAYGMKRFDGMYSVVTAGVGVFGPNMRLGAHPEIAVVDVRFGKV